MSWLGVTNTAEEKRFIPNSNAWLHQLINIVKISSA